MDVSFHPGFGASSLHQEQNVVRISRHVAKRGEEGE